MNEKYSFNDGRFFFWFGLNRELEKFYDRKYGVDHFASKEGFPEIFRAAIEQLEISQISELEVRLVEPELKQIAAQVIASKAAVKAAPTS